VTRKNVSEKKELKEKLKTVSDYKSDLQYLINKIARLIDYGQNCISCNCVPKKSNGCHFKSVGSHSKLRYNLLNIYLGCNKCNSELGGNVHGYDDGVIAHFGREFWEYIKFQMVLDFPILKIDFILKNTCKYRILLLYLRKGLEHLKTDYERKYIINILPQHL
jgi:hypothetical protein